MKFPQLKTYSNQKNYFGVKLTHDHKKPFRPYSNRRGPYQYRLTRNMLLHRDLDFTHPTRRHDAHLYATYRKPQIQSHRQILALQRFAQPQLNPRIYNTIYPDQVNSVSNRDYRTVYLPQANNLNITNTTNSRYTYAPNSYAQDQYNNQINYLEKNFYIPDKKQRAKNYRLAWTRQALSSRKPRYQYVNLNNYNNQNYRLGSAYNPDKTVLLQFTPPENIRWQNLPETLPQKFQAQDAQRFQYLGLPNTNNYNPDNVIQIPMSYSYVPNNMRLSFNSNNPNNNSVIKIETTINENNKNIIPEFILPLLENF